MVYYNATITFYGPKTSPTAIFTSLTVAILASFRHWHFYRQSGMCSGIIYPFYTHITVRACTYMFMLELQLVIPYHNRHTHCPRLSPSVMSHLEMVCIQHGTVRGSLSPKSKSGKPGAPTLCTLGTSVPIHPTFHRHLRARHASKKTQASWIVTSNSGP